MKVASLPPGATWAHRGVREGFEVLFLDAVASGYRLRGCTAAREHSRSWAVSYDIHLDEGWNTRTVEAVAIAPGETREVYLARDPAGRWKVNGAPRPDLDGCVDVDFESSAATNTLPIHRLNFVIGETVEVTAAFVRAEGGRIERLEQRYTLIGMSGDGLTFRYESPTVDFTCVLAYDVSGLVLEYPGIAIRDA